MLDSPPRERAPTRVGVVMASLKARIDSRALAPGARLPSVRALAANLAVSKSTVVEAYERLVAEGDVTARRGSGFFVAGPTRPLMLARVAEPREPVADWMRSHRAALSADPDRIQPGSGWLPESWMPEVGMQRALRDLARDRAFHKARYDSPIGYEPLRRQLAVRLADRGVVASPDQIVLTEFDDAGDRFGAALPGPAGRRGGGRRSELFPPIAVAEGAPGRCRRARR